MRWLCALWLALALGCGEETAEPAPGDAAVDAAAPDASRSADAGADAIADAIDAMADAPDAIDAISDAIADAAPDDCPVALGAARIGGGELDPLDFGRSAARGPRAVVDLRLTNLCARPLRFLGHPDDWVEGPGFGLQTLPPIALEPGESTELRLGFTPGAPGPASGRLRLPYDRPGAPLSIDLAASVAGPRAVVFVGDGRHVVTTADYGATVGLDTFETLVAHGDELQRGVCWGAGRFVAVGGNVDSRWWTSPDGIAWQAHAADTGVMAGCAYGNGRFVAAAGAPLSSEDGITWQVGRSDGFAPEHLRAMAFGGGVFVAVGDRGRVVSTTDGTGWDTDAVLDIGGLGAVAWGDGRFVAVGEGGAVASSPDGVAWTTGVIPGAGRLGGVAYADGGFVAGDGARVHGSADGIDWQPINAASAVPRVGFGGLLFGNAGNTLLRSEDGGFSWTEWHVSPDGLGLGGAAVQGL